MAPIEKEKKIKGRERVKKGEGGSLRKVGRTDGRTDRHSGDFILCPMLCIALDKQELGF